MYQRILKPPATSFFLLGPRGTGKTTWLRSAFPNAYRIDLLDEARYQRYLGDVSLFARELRARPEGSWVAVDEVQRLPTLLNEVHRAMEDRRLKFAMTGSSARKFKRAGVNLLAGRAVHRTMYPFAPEEIGDDFDLERALRFGTLPVIWASEDPGDALDAYARLYLKEEIQAEALVRNLPGFARFLPVASLLHGQVVNLSNVARDTGVARTTAQGYLDVLEDTLLVSRLPAYEAKLRVRERKHPKLYFVDAGIVRALRPSHGIPGPEERGALLEGFVYMLLRLYSGTHGLCDEVFYWAPGEAHLTEVDFLAVAGAESFAIEVKSASRIREDHFRGLRAIEGLKGLRARVLVHLGEEEGRTGDGIEVLPLSAFLGRLAKGRLSG